jgi:glycosyltransferase involved in cell wall biosynthesis
MKDLRINILFILPSLKAGGAEKIISFLSKNLDNSTFNITLLVIGYEQDSKFDINGIDTVFLNKTRLLKATKDIFKYIKNSKPNIVLSSIGHVNILMGLFSLYFQNIKFIAREASVNNIMQTFSRKKQLPSWIKKILYNQLDMIICQSQDMRDDFIKLYNYPIKKCVIINNPITKSTDDYLTHSKTKNNPLIKFITIGRLSQEKGHLRILKEIKKLNFDFQYTIIGTGELKEIIVNKISEYKLENKVKMIDHTNNVYSFLEESTLFLQGSYVEGFPNALLEAVSIGIPAIVFEAPGGTKEIVDHGINGYIVKNDFEYSDIIQKAVKQKWNHLKIIETAQNKFSSKKILGEYSALFTSV